MSVQTTNATKVYIAGPMTGKPNFNIEAFDEAESQLAEAGYLVSNPAHRGGGEFSWEFYARRGVMDLLVCDGVAILPGYGESRGATLEVHVAQALHMPVLSVRQWLRLMPDGGRPTEPAAPEPRSLDE